MKRTLIKDIPRPLPEEVIDLMAGAPVYDSSCSPTARVYLIDKDGGYFLKRSPRGTLAREAMMDEYFHSLGLGAKVKAYISGEEDFLITERLFGEDGTHEIYLCDPKRLCDIYATRLRALHEIRPTGCPVVRTADYIKAVEDNYRTECYDRTQFPDSFGFRTPDEAIGRFREGKDYLKCDTLLHGDYCLPNVILDNWSLSGYIDLDSGGVGDRHVDIFWGCFTLYFNLHTTEYTDRFLDAYGRDKIEPELLHTVAAAEVFG